MSETRFDPEKMYTRLQGYCAALHWDDAARALAFAREAHSNQIRKSGEPYIIHPLTMACHATALGVQEEPVVAAIALHDVPEDCGIAVEDLPVRNPAIKDAVRRLTHVKTVPLDVYYDEIAKDPVASMGKLFDRCDNVSTMAGVFSDEKTRSYIQESRQYVMPLWRRTKDHWPQYSSQLFVIKYHILSILNSLDAVVK